MSEPAKAQKLSLSLDYRFVTLGLLAVIIVMFFLWKPWVPKTTDRTIEVNGQATVSARPDEFLFYPSYHFSNSNKQTALFELAAKSEQLVSELKKLGVADKDIKTNSSGWSYPIYDGGSDKTPTYTLSLTVTVDSDELAQKVQDYLVTTEPIGGVSPQATFSEQKRKEVEDKARDQATKDARKKADQSAKNLGFRLSSVKTVNDGSGFGGIIPFAERSMAADIANPEASLSLQPGENELTYTVTVTYFIK